MTNENICISIPEITQSSIESKTLRKILFINNAIEDGWNVSKKNENYVFTKKHEGRRKVFSENYLAEFIVKNLSQTT